MRIKLCLQSNQNSVYIPTGYKKYIQGLIYKCFDNKEKKWIHEKGYKYEKRSFKLFNFSTFLENGNYLKDNKTFKFSSPVSFYISSPAEWMMKSIAEDLISRKEIRLGKNILSLKYVEVMNKPEVNNEKIRVRTLTPVEVHSTLYKGDDQKKTYYYNPAEEEYTQLIEENIKKKWEAYQEEKLNKDYNIEPVSVDKMSQTVQYFKDIVIKGWNGHFYIEGPSELIHFILDTGIGSRNSAGFGMIEKLD